MNVAGAGAAPRSDIGDSRAGVAWRVLGQVEDPEMPVLTLVDLGIVRFVREAVDGALAVGLSPTYTGCPATEHIQSLAEEALERAGLRPFSITRVLSPAWSSDWITPDGHRKLREYGIVPPVASTAATRASRAPTACPHCGSMRTECLSEFGSTPCKALHRCRDCLEPFECFKCI